MRQLIDSAAARIALLLPALLLAGCPPQEKHQMRLRPFRSKGERPPAVAYCNDHTGHVAGSRPFVLGGTCCCTPSQELADAYHRDGILLEYGVGRLKDLYRGLGIKTARDHRDCNNRCSWGPHVLQGGKCMVPPTPGTQHYEEIITGRFALPMKTLKPH